MASIYSAFLSLPSTSLALSHVVLITLIIIISISQWRYWGSERLNNLLKVIQVAVRAKIKPTQAFSTASASTTRVLPLVEPKLSGVHRELNRILSNSKNKARTAYYLGLRRRVSGLSERLAESWVRPRLSYSVLCAWCSVYISAFWGK